MKFNTATALADVHVCAPPFPWNETIHHLAGPTAAVLFLLALVGVLAAKRMRYAGPTWAVTTIQIAAALGILAGALCLVAIPMTHTC